MAADKIIPQLPAGKGAGDFKGFLRKSRGQPGLGKVENAHGLTAQSGHGSGRFVTPGEFMILRLVGQGLTEEFGRSGGAPA